jgi:hypothetical protein
VCFMTHWQAYCRGWSGGGMIDLTEYGVRSTQGRVHHNRGGISRTPWPRLEGSLKPLNVPLTRPEACRSTWQLLCHKPHFSSPPTIPRHHRLVFVPLCYVLCMVARDLRYDLLLFAWSLCGVIGPAAAFHCFLWILNLVWPVVVVQVHHLRAEKTGFPLT